MTNSHSSHMTASEIDALKAQMAEIQAKLEELSKLVPVEEPVAEEPLVEEAAGNGKADEAVDGDVVENASAVDFPAEEIIQEGAVEIDAAMENDAEADASQGFANAVDDASLEDQLDAAVLQAEDVLAQAQELAQPKQPEQVAPTTPQDQPAQPFQPTQPLYAVPANPEPAAQQPFAMPVQPDAQPAQAVEPDAQPAQPVQPDVQPAQPAGYGGQSAQFSSNQTWQQPFSSAQSAGGYAYSAPYGQTQQQSPYTAPYNPAGLHTKDHVAAGLLGIFLGCLGIHKFYLGYNTAGFIMLGVSILGGIFTFGLAWSAMWLIGLIEGVMYLVKSQADFEQSYIYKKRDWF